MNRVGVNRTSVPRFGNDNFNPKQLDRTALQEKLLNRLAPHLEWSLKLMDKRIAQKDYSDVKSEDIMAQTVITNMTTLLTTIFR